ncbi:MAG: Lpg1974 family pore-forming outer membrane protein [Gammaproteobacteria bacterium]|jgi:hypothetical protein
MKRIYQQLLVFSCAASVLPITAYAQQLATVPQLEGGVTFTVGTFYAAPNVSNQPYAYLPKSSEQNDRIPTNEYLNLETDYHFGFEASLGYVFENTANGIELSYRGLNANKDNTTVKNSSIDVPGFNGFEADEAANQLKNEFNTADLMISQFIDIGQAMQMRFQAGLAYTDIKQDNNTTFSGGENLTGGPIEQKSHSEYQGWGPRIGIDARYDFGDDIEGLGIVVGGSVAYFFGELNSNSSLTEEYDVQDNTDNHAVLNLRGNIGIDYVYFFEDEESTLGIELGYLADYYNEAVNQIFVDQQYVQDPAGSSFDTDTVSSSFMGPYVSIKGVF